MQSRIREWDLTGTYCQAWPESFLDMADVVLVVESKQLPAHSQCLANKSGMIGKMLEDCPAFSKQQPVVIQSALDNYTVADIQLLLKHVYSSVKMSTASEAMQLLIASDHFDCPELTQRAVQHLESSNDVCLAESCNGALYWLQIAHQFNLSSLMKRCVKFVITHLEAFEEDAQMQHLAPAIYLQLLRRQCEVPRHHLRSVNPSSDSEKRRDCGCNACKAPSQLQGAWGYPGVAAR